MIAQLDYYGHIHDQSVNDKSLGIDKTREVANEV